MPGAAEANGVLVEGGALDQLGDLALVVALAHPMGVQGDALDADAGA
jgi:hypothetical protein